MPQDIKKAGLFKVRIRDLRLTCGHLNWSCNDYDGYGKQFCGSEDILDFCCYCDTVTVYVSDSNCKEIKKNWLQLGLLNKNIEANYGFLED